MRYVAALFALFLLVAAASPADAGPRHRRDNAAHSQGHGHGHGAHDGRRGDRRDGVRPRFERPRGHRHLDGPRVLRPHGNVMPLGRVLHGLRRDHPGRHLNVRPAWGMNGEPYYRVKWLTPDGRVLRLYVDARTGQVVDVDGAPRRRGPGS